MKKDKALKKAKSPKPPRIKHRGLRRPVTLICWAVLIGSTSFGVYKNMTAVDTHTVHETQVIKTKVVDTHALATFTTDFAKIFYAWQPHHEALDQRQNNLKPYLAEQLQNLNADTIRGDIPTTATVESVKVWDVSQSSKNTYRVLYTVTQVITKGKDKKTVSSTYATHVLRNTVGNMVIVKNPTIAAEPGTAVVKLPDVQADNSVDSATTADVTKFLKTFFSLYPQGDKNELKYYVDGGTQPIKRDLRFAELQDLILKQTKKGIRATVSVNYLDTVTSMTQISQYDLMLTNQNQNWMIINGI